MCVHMGRRGKDDGWGAHAHPLISLRVNHLRFTSRVWKHQ